MQICPPHFPRSGCPFPVPNPNAERYRPSTEHGEWSLITGFFEVNRHYGVLREDGTPEHILFHTLSGRGFIVTDDGWTLAMPDRTLIIEAEVPHYYATHPDTGYWAFHWAHFFPPPDWTFLHEIPRRLPRVHVVDPAPDHPGREAIPVALKEAHNLRQQSLPNPTALAMNALERALLWAASGASNQVGLDPRIRKVTDQILARPAQTHSVEDLARIAGLSTSRFAHLFREQTGESPQNYVERVRLSLADEWLRAGGRSVSEIADALGFRSPFYFSRRFRKAFGKSPSSHAAQRLEKSKSEA